VGALDDLGGLDQHREEVAGGGVLRARCRPAKRRPEPFAEEAMLEAGSGIRIPFVEPTPTRAPAPSDAPAMPLTTPSYLDRDFAAG
jgi:hypothetical protein